ncbi:MAG: sugar ABC transporter permease [Alphaproteobacteria bacterium]|nr:sugar ABC transporter permease [Alphaproteobacteria bacterium]
MSFIFNKKIIPILFVLPVVSLHLLVVAFPSFSSLALSVTDWNGFGKIKYVGFENFEELFDDRVFKKAIKHNLIWTIFFLTVPIAIALLGAYLLTGIKRFQLFYRLVFFFPYILASIVNALIWKYLFHPLHGLGAWFNEKGIDFLASSPFANKETSLYAVAFVDAWHFWGFLVVIYITGMYQVDDHLYEAADIEGATKWQKFIYITLPMIRPVFIFSLMIVIIWSVPVFDYIYILTQGGPAYSSEVIANHLYSQAFDRFKVGYASAIGVMMCFYVILIVGLFGLLRRMGWEI